MLFCKLWLATWDRRWGEFARGPTRLHAIRPKSALKSQTSANEALTLDSELGLAGKGGGKTEPRSTCH